MIRETHEPRPGREAEPTQAMPRLSQSLRMRHLSMISIGGIIGAGLFVGSSAGIAAAGPGIVVSYLLAGMLVLLIMRMLGEMSTALPDVRSFTEFARAGLGGWAGFTAGWLYWYFWMIVVPVEAIAGANILHTFSPALPAWIYGVALVLIMTVVNMMSARFYGEFEFWFASVKVAAIIAFVGLAASYVLGWFPGSHSVGFVNLVGAGGFAPHGWGAVLAGSVVVFFSMTGTEIITVAAAESSEGARAVARATSSVIVRILTFYVGSVFLIICVVPWTAVHVGDSPFTLALRTMKFDWASTAMSLIILTAVLSCLNSAFYVCSRVLFVLAEHGDAPGWLVQLNGRRVPIRSVAVGALAGVLGIAAATFAPQVVFAFLVNASGALMVLIYIIITLAQIRLRRQREASGAPAPSAGVWLFPWSSYAAIAGMVAVLIAMALTPAMQRDFYVSVVAFIISLVAFFLNSHHRSGKINRVVESPISSRQS